MKKTVKLLLSFLSWLTVSPLFLYLTNHWNLMKKWQRIVLMLFSPLFLVIYAIIVIILFIWIELTWPDFFPVITGSRDDIYFSNSKRLERITEAKFDIDHIVSYQAGERSFLGDYNDETIIKLENKPNYMQLESLVKEGKWSKTESGYWFHSIWGNGYPAPPGEDDNVDRMLTIIVPLNSDTIVINSGKW